MKIKILIAGIGGVGGYFGGLLAKEYENSDTVEINFLSRGENLNKIKNEGLTVFEDKAKFIARPNLVSNSAEDFGGVDYVFLCTKTYSLKGIMEQITPCIRENTVIIPLQNGVNNREIISAKFKSNLVTEGCVYIVSRLEKPGIIVKKGQAGTLSFGVENTTDKRLDNLQKIMLNAGIKSELTPQIQKIIWEKFTFLSAIATATTYFNANIYEILNDNLKCNALKLLIDEVIQLAHSKKVKIRKNQSVQIIKMLKSLPPESTTSMHSDYLNKKVKTELETLTGYVVEEGKKYNVATKTFEKMYNEIKENK